MNDSDLWPWIHEAMKHLEKGILGVTCNIFISLSNDEFRYKFTATNCNGDIWATTGTLQHVYEFISDLVHTRLGLEVKNDN